MTSNVEIKKKVGEEMEAISNFLGSPMFRNTIGESKQLELRLMYSWLEDLYGVVRIYRLQETENVRLVTEKDKNIKALESKIEDLNTKIKDMEKFSYLMV